MQPSRRLIRRPRGRDAAAVRSLRKPSATTRSPLPDIAGYCEPFRVEVHHERDTVRVAPIGELDLVTADTLRGQLDELTVSGFRSIVLDLRGLEFIDVIGLSLIMRFDKHARDRNLQFALIQGSAQAQRLFELTGMLGQLPFLNSNRPEQTTGPGGTPKVGTGRIASQATGAAAALNHDGKPSISSLVPTSE